MEGLMQNVRCKQPMSSISVCFINTTIIIFYYPDLLPNRCKNAILYCTHKTCCKLPATPYSKVVRYYRYSMCATMRFWFCCSLCFRCLQLFFFFISFHFLSFHSLPFFTAEPGRIEVRSIREYVTYYMIIPLCPKFSEMCTSYIENSWQYGLMV